MPDASEFLRRNSSFYNGKLNLPETLEAYAQAYLEAYLQKTGQLAFVAVGYTLVCKKCGAPFKKAKKLIKHGKKHQAMQREAS